MSLLLRLCGWAVGVAAVLVAGYVGAFVAYGLSHGFDVASGVQHLYGDDVAPTTTQPRLDNVPWQRVSWLGDIQNKDLNESSGLAASNIHPNVLWSMNDSGSEPMLFAVGLDGSDLGAWPVDTDLAFDWESMDAFMWQGKPYLIIGDTGDNFRWRPQVHFLVVAEPADLATSGDTLDVAWQVTYNYPNGYRDSEALTVDAANEHVYVLSKRHHPPELFRLPLRADAPVVAEHVQTLEDFPLPLFEEVEEDDGRPYRHMPGGMDLADGRLLISTYKHSYLYALDNLGQKPLRVRMPSVGQREALSFAAGRHDRAYVSRERREGHGVADLFLIEFEVEPATSAVEPLAAPASAQRLPEGSVSGQ